MGLLTKCTGIHTFSARNRYSIAFLASSVIVCAVGLVADGRRAVGFAWPWLVVVSTWSRHRTPTSTRVLLLFKIDFFNSLFASLSVINFY